MENKKKFWEPKYSWQGMLIDIGPIVPVIIGLFYGQTWLVIIGAFFCVCRIIYGIIQERNND